MLSDLMLLNLMYSRGLGMDLKENRVAVGHKECHGIINHHGSDSCSQLSLTIQLTSKKQSVPYRKEHCCVFTKQDR